MIWVIIYALLFSHNEIQRYPYTNRICIGGTIHIVLLDDSTIVELDEHRLTKACGRRYWLDSPIRDSEDAFSIKKDGKWDAKIAEGNPPWRGLN